MRARGYESLTYRGQVGRLRVLGRRALVRFGLRVDAPLVLLNHGENSVFESRDMRGRRYALRIHRTDYQTPGTIRSELAWLAALGRDTDLALPRPVEGTDGALVQQVTDDGVPGERSCVLLQWVPGRFGWTGSGRSYYRRLGHVAGRLHAHGQAWKRPAGFRRRAWSQRVLQGLAPGFGDALTTPGVNKRDSRLFRAAQDRATGVMAALGKGRATWGLIHADLHAGNVLTHDGVMGAIDFDDCGSGWYGYEFAVAVGPPFDMVDFERRLAWFLDSYREHMEVDPRTLESLECFVVTRRISMVGWIGSRADNPRLARLVPRYTTFARDAARAWMRR